MDYRRLSPRRIDQLARPIHPGCWAVDARKPLSTLLGSCIAVCLYDPINRVGGLNHFMLPTMRRSGHALPSPLAGDRAMAALLNALLDRGASRAHLQAKVFGGGTIVAIDGAAMDIGLRNATFAKNWLRAKKIPLLASDLLGPWSRKLLFLPDSGIAFCRRIAATTDGVVANMGQEADGAATRRPHWPTTI